MSVVPTYDPFGPQHPHKYQHFHPIEQSSRKPTAEVRWIGTESGGVGGCGAVQSEYEDPNGRESSSPDRKAVHHPSRSRYGAVPICYGADARLYKGDPVLDLEGWTTSRGIALQGMNRRFPEHELAVSVHDLAVSRHAFGVSKHETGV
eukprot:1395342-Rhodomonas_salina.1